MGHISTSRWAAVYIRQGNWGPGRHRGWSGPRWWRLIRVAWTRGEEIALWEETHVQIWHPGSAQYSTEQYSPGSWLAGLGLFKPCSVKVGPSVGQGGVSSGEIGSGLNKAGLSTDRHILPSPVCQVY